MKYISDKKLTEWLAKHILKLKPTKTGKFVICTERCVKAGTVAINKKYFDPINNFEHLKRIEQKMWDGGIENRSKYIKALCDLVKTPIIDYYEFHILEIGDILKISLQQRCRTLREVVREQKKLRKQLDISIRNQPKFYLLS